MNCSAKCTAANANALTPKARRLMKKDGLSSNLGHNLSTGDIIKERERKVKDKYPVTFAIAKVSNSKPLKFGSVLV